MSHTRSSLDWPFPGGLIDLTDLPVVPHFTILDTRTIGVGDVKRTIQFLRDYNVPFSTNQRYNCNCCLTGILHDDHVFALDRSAVLQRRFSIEFPKDYFICVHCRGQLYKWLPKEPVDYLQHHQTMTILGWLHISLREWWIFHPDYKLLYELAHCFHLKMKRINDASTIHGGGKMKPLLPARHLDKFCEYSADLVHDIMKRFEIQPYCRLHYTVRRAYFIATPPNRSPQIPHIDNYNEKLLVVIVSLSQSSISTHFPMMVKRDYKDGHAADFLKNGNGISDPNWRFFCRFPTEMFDISIISPAICHSAPNTYDEWRYVFVLACYPEKVAVNASHDTLGESECYLIAGGNKHDGKYQQIINREKDRLKGVSE